MSKQFHDTEEEQAIKEAEAAAPFKIAKAKSMNEALAEQEEEDEMPALFPGGELRALIGSANQAQPWCGGCKS